MQTLTSTDFWTFKLWDHTQCFYEVFSTWLLGGGSYAAFHTVSKDWKMGGNVTFILLVIIPVQWERHHNDTTPMKLQTQNCIVKTVVTVWATVQVQLLSYVSYETTPHGLAFPTQVKYVSREEQKTVRYSHSTSIHISHTWKPRYDSLDTKWFFSICLILYFNCFYFIYIFIVFGFQPKYFFMAKYGHSLFCHCRLFFIIVHS